MSKKNKKTKQTKLRGFRHFQNNNNIIIRKIKGDGGIFLIFKKPVTQQKNGEIMKEIKSLKDLCILSLAKKAVLFKKTDERNELMNVIRIQTPEDVGDVAIEKIAELDYCNTHAGYAGYQLGGFDI